MKKTIIKVCSVMMAVSLMALSFSACGGNDDYEKTGDVTTNETTTVTEPAKDFGKLNPLTGLDDISESAVGARPVAIMVENSPAARPQWGLTSPDIVLEGVVEGGITRMLWIYSDVKNMPKVGPVRSARHDYVEIAQGMNAIYCHAGGSYLAYDLIASIGMKDIDGLKAEGKHFSRDTSRNTAIEHRLYTDGEKMAKAIGEKKLETKAKDTNWTPFTVITDGERLSFGDKTGAAMELYVEFSSSYTHTFKYKPEEKLYYNYMNGKEMKDGNNNKTMAVTNLIVMYSNTKVVDSDGHQDWDLTSGKGLYVSHGVGEHITWKKNGQNAPLKFYGADGKELTVNKGKTWIGVVPTANASKTDAKEMA